MEWNIGGYYAIAKHIQLPHKRKKIDAWNRQSIYILKLVVPKDISLAFKEYSYNFFTAAHLIGSYLLETNLTDISKLDTYFFSLAFLYRHSIELLLKAIAFQQIKTTDDRAAFVKDTFSQSGRNTKNA